MRNNSRRVGNLSNFPGAIVFKPRDGTGRIGQTDQLRKTIPGVLPHPVPGGDHLHQVPEGVVLMPGCAPNRVRDGRDIPTGCIGECGGISRRVGNGLRQSTDRGITGLAALLMCTHHIWRTVADRLLRVGERPACPQRVRETRQNTSGIVFKRGGSPQRVRYACDLPGGIARETDCLTGRVEHRHNIVVFIVLKGRKHAGRIGNLQDIAFRGILPRCGFPGTIENSYRVRIHY